MVYEMKFEQFIVKITSLVAKKLGDNYEVHSHEMIKNNHTLLNSIMISRVEDNVRPNIYLENYYDEYCEGKDLEDLANEIIDVYFRAKEKQSFDVDNIYDFDEYKERIFYRIVHFEKNKEQLEKIPYKRYLDFAITYHCMLSNNQNILQSFVVSKDLLRYWNITEEELHCYAKINTPKMFPPKLETMDALFENIMYGKKKKIDENEKLSYDDAVQECILKLEASPAEPMYVISNSIGTNGASAILYPKYIDALANTLQSNLFLLPSSIHEFIVIPEGDYEIQALEDMVTEVNETRVQPEEVLSNRVYFYDWTERKIS